MANYADLVLCKDKHGAMKLFQAPAFAHLDIGTMVLCEDECDVRTVVATASVDAESPEYGLIGLLNHGQPITKIEKTAVFFELNYPEEVAE